MIRPDLYADRCCIKVRFFVEMIVDLRCRSSVRKRNGLGTDFQTQSGKAGRVGWRSRAKAGAFVRIEASREGGPQLLFATCPLCQSRPAVWRPCNQRLQK